MSDNGSALPRLMERYRSEIKSRLYEKFNYQNLAQVPRLFSVTLNVGLGEALQNARLLEAASEELKIISGQKPVITKARKSVANFRLREGQSIGCMVTLRSRRMYEFMDRVINIVLPRLRDFHGVSNKSFDAQGNYSIGFRDQSVFPELTFEETSTPHGMQVNFVIDAKSKEDAKALLTKFGMPFMKEGR